MTTTPRAIGYCRVSTESQLDGLGMDIQRDAIVELAAAQGLLLAAVFVDEGISGSEGLEVRTGLAEAVDDLIEHPGTTLIVPRLDRLARDLMVQEQVLAECWKAQGLVTSCSETERAYCHPDNPDDPARKMIRQMLGAVAEYERSMIRVRLVRGRRRRLAETGWAGGPRPYGWDDPDELAVLEHIESQRRAGVTWRRLVDDITGRGVVKRNGKPWTFQELQQVHRKALARGPISPRELAS